MLRPDYIKFGAIGKIWSARQKREHGKQIVYRCEDCGNEFISGLARTVRLCSDCAGKRRREGKGPIQLKQKPHQ